MQTFGSMCYRRVGDQPASPAAETEVAALVEQLRQIRSRLGRFEGAIGTRRSSAMPATSTITITIGRPSGGARPAAAAMTTTPSGRAQDGSRYVMRPPSPYADT